MHKIKASQLTTETIKQNPRGTIDRFVASDNAFSFMGSVKGTPAYWKQFLCDGPVVGIPTYFLTLSCRYLRWEELPYIVNKFKNLSYQDRCNLPKNNPVLLARHFQYKAETFFKEMVHDGPLGKTKYYTLPIEIQKRGSPHIY